MKKIDIAYSDKWAAEKEQVILDIFDEIQKLEEQGLITRDDVLAAKNVIFNFGDESRKSVTSVSYQDYIRDVRRAYKYLQEGKISHDIYRKIIRYRLTDLDAILNYYKKGGFDIDISYCNLVTAISFLSDYYLYGVINEQEYNSFVDKCFSAGADKCILVDSVGYLGTGQKLHKAFMQKIEANCKVVGANIGSISVKIAMIDSFNHNFTIKKLKILGKVFISLS